MKIKFSKDYSWAKMMSKYDRRRLRDGEDLSTPSGYPVTWEDADVTQEQLEEYAGKGYAIKINC